MGSILDSAKEIRQDKSDTPGQAHGSEAELEKDKAQGLIFIGKDINIRYYFPCLYPEDFNKFIGKGINVHYYLPCLCPEDFNKFYANIKVFLYHTNIKVFLYANGGSGVAWQHRGLWLLQPGFKFRLPPVLILKE